MRIAVIGRTQPLLEAARILAGAGHRIPLVWTARAEDFYTAGAEDFRALAQACGARFVEGAAINTDEALAILCGARCDAAVSVNFPGVIGEAALRAFPRRPEDGRIDWSRPADEICRLVRASSRPFAGAFTFLEGREKIIVWRAEPYAYPTPYPAVPGRLCLLDGGAPAAACGEGMLRLSEIEGDYDKQRMRSLRSRLH